MSPFPPESSVLAMYRSHASAAAATDVLQRAGLDGRRITVVSFGPASSAAPDCSEGPYFLLARGSAEVLTHARMVLTPAAIPFPRSTSTRGVTVH